ncbi:hypothetical protein ACH5RR_029864 [Cinchona calisaya]|uniref:Reverse transcriptase domain-containing protein n=1 Tax=Cinchona calisaya TaxID=153742 RepID=A0ABD2YT15_9GENT
MGQMATSISRLEAQSSGKLPSQTIINPKENVSAITLRSGKEVDVQQKLVPELIKAEKKKTTVEKEVDPCEKKSSSNEDKAFPEVKPEPPFPEALNEFSKENPYKELYDTFHKCEVNIPLLDAT